ncbi:hypothetical protein Pan216_08160 [Planctomycetes bacterium Pan216]|uniref:Uncharacterized protein n=1 Tax=Kolteria novifilia TaxID=2527975 RepID=A0A518AZ50_9BACT|nr:hypothetical protein Pan216_08160 [Planctomycetes bacterium Pan216]
MAGSDTRLLNSARAAYRSFTLSVFPEPAMARQSFLTHDVRSACPRERGTQSCCHGTREGGFGDWKAVAERVMARFLVQSQPKRCRCWPRKAGPLDVRRRVRLWTFRENRTRSATIPSMISGWGKSKPDGKHRSKEKPKGASLVHIPRWPILEDGLPLARSAAWETWLRVASSSRLSYDRSRPQMVVARETLLVFPSPCTSDISCGPLTADLVKSLPLIHSGVLSAKPGMNVRSRPFCMRGRGDRRVRWWSLWHLHGLLTVAPPLGQSFAPLKRRRAYDHGGWTCPH